MNTPWQVKAAEARMTHFGQRAYRSQEAGIVRFYPSRASRRRNGTWFETDATESSCHMCRDYRLTDEEAKAIWATRPEGMK